MSDNIEFTAEDYKYMDEFLQREEANQQEEQRKAEEPPQPNIYLTQEEAQFIQRLIEQEIYQQKKLAKVNMDGTGSLDLRLQEAELQKSENFPLFKRVLQPLRSKVFNIT